ncbi:OmpA family protein [Thalassotalea profundi]|uniref:OmpA-like domain-containing protein n=1 Tax=Thalassotalea profundi TaxID=2036687 RepID=A0ABQ3IMS9_9GAMM|nr:OmpA family protein [Thalassotalea profundi]GHE88919.1 hypothetical protein GCM10011501_17940 [Thalassotalea profundi]
MNKLKVRPSLLASSIALAIFTTYPVFADQFCDESTVCTSRDLAGRVSENNNLVLVETQENAERNLATASWIFLGLPDVSSKHQDNTLVETNTLEVENLPKINFSSGKHTLAKELIVMMDKAIDVLKDKKNVRLSFVGHADNQALSARALKIYKDNVDLSKSRARAVSEYFKKKLQLSDIAITIDGKGSAEPLASNLTAEGMAKNRRVELQAWFDDVVVPEPLMAMARNNICDFSGVKELPFVITIDGQLLNDADQSSDADNQRCTDVALDNADIKLQYDNLSIKPALNITPVLSEVNEDSNVNESNKSWQIQWQGYSNYLDFIDKAEIRLFSTKQSSQADPHTVIPLNTQLQAQWALPDTPAAEYYYLLRVYDSAGNFDETQLTTITTGAPIRPELPLSQATLSGYGESRLVLQNIPLNGGTLTVNGQKVPTDHQVYFLGQQIPVNEQGEFVNQQIIPSGQFNAEVAVLDEQGNGQLFQRHLELKSDDWFYVGLADITVGKNSTIGAAELVTQNEAFDDDLFIDGRLAFYAKGKWQDKYTITTSIDSTEEPIEDLLSNFDKKDPASLLRRLEQENHYAVYGDDSTLVDDAPTQGRFYAKINDHKSHLMWGNFISDINDTEFARIERGLYGANIDWNSEKLTNFGERTTQVDLFAAEAGTNAAYEEFRGTGGSLYYLSNQDISQGSERLSIEIRDKDSGLILSSQPLVAGVDYDVNAIQGRVLLTRPLSSISQDNQTIRTGGLSGHAAYLVVNYEYTPGFDELDELAFGGRVSHWINDSWKIGFSGSKQDMGLEEHKLQGVDLTYRYSAQSYIKLEGAQTQGQGVAGTSSNNGGYYFDQLTTAVTTDDKAKALRVESAFVFKDLGINNNGRGNVYWQYRDADFSGVGQFSQYETEQVGAQISLPMGKDTEALLKVDSREEKGGIDKLSAEFNLNHALNEYWAVSAGLRAEDSEAATVAQQQNVGKRTDLAVQVDYQHNEKWGLLAFVQGTLNHDDSKLANNRTGIGGNYQITKNIKLNGEVSDGNQGFGALIGSEYQYDDASNIYLNYALDPDRTDNGLGGRNGQLVSGVRHRYSDTINVYGEERYQHGDSRVGLTHAYGIEYLPSERWLLSLSLENGTQEEPGLPSLERNTVAINVNYATTDFKYGGALEFRNDKQEQDERDSYLVRNNLSYKVNPDWRAQLRIDIAISDSNIKDSLNSDYSEALLGFAYRPVDNDKFNALLTYNYLYDLAPAEQFTASYQQNDYQQRSHVVAVDINYDLSARWTIGAKLAHRKGEIRAGREAGEWFDSTSSLYVVKLDWHLIRHWDFLVEGRMLDVSEADDKRSGMLIALHRHIGENFKIGVGYNFTDFSDDLTDLNYDSKGWFINLVGKF